MDLFYLFLRNASIWADYNGNGALLDFSDDGNAFNCDDPYLIRIRGLPWTTTKRDIIEFFDGVDILNGEDGIHMVTLSSIPNRPLGEAYIQLASQNDLDLAHTFDRKNLGSRYIEGGSMWSQLLCGYLNYK